jgi:serine/threonine protein kinase
VLAQLCEVLRVMHEMNIAHRDLTPGNVLIREIKRGRNEEVKRLIVVCIIKI